VRYYVSSIRFDGGSGLVIRIALLPSADSALVPFSLVAESLAQTESYQSRLKGEARNTETGIEQDRLLKTTGSDPLQFVSSCEKLVPSTCLIDTVY
jgi:hypothetical protein